MDLKELMIAASGQDEHGMPKGSVVLLNEFWFQNGERESVDELAIDSPVVELFAGDGFVQLDMKFGSKYNIDLSLAHEMISRFRVVENSIDDEAERLPVTTVVLLPTDYEGQYYLACLNPIFYCLTADQVDGELTVLSMTFLEDSVLMYESEDFAADEEMSENVEEE